MLSRRRVLELEQEKNWDDAVEETRRVDENTLRLRKLRLAKQSADEAAGRKERSSPAAGPKGSVAKRKKSKPS